MDLSAESKYTSEAKGNYIDQREYKKREAQKKQEIENKQNVHQGIPISQIYKFFAYEDKYSQYKDMDSWKNEPKIDFELEKKNLENEGEINKMQSLMNFFGENDRVLNNDGSLKVGEKFNSTLTYEEANKYAHLG